MRYRILVVIACLTGCGGKDEPRVAVAAVAPRPPIGLYGNWAHIAPTALRGDTLTLRADSTANGLIPWDEDRAARITRWKLIFGSKDPVAARADWRLGHNDGGDVECSNRAHRSPSTLPVRSGKQAAASSPTTGCQSMPMLCFGTVAEWHCETFHYVAPDSLSLMDGSRFIRVKTAVNADTARQVRQ